jgi:PAS domain-containing protein
MKDDDLHFEELVKERTTESGRSIEHLDREIAERRRIELELKESERQCRLLADAITDVIWTLDLEGGIYVSPSVERLLNQS